MSADADPPAAEADRPAPDAARPTDDGERPALDAVRPAAESVRPAADSVRPTHGTAAPRNPPSAAAARTALLVTAAYALAMAVWLLLPWTAGTRSAGSWVVLVGVGATRVAVAVLLLRVLRLTSAVGLRTGPAPRTWRFAVPLLVLPALPVLLGPGLAQAPAWRFAVATALTATVAFGEEAVFRGVVLRVLLGRGVRAAVLGSAVCFGLMHSVNLLAGDHPVTVAAQVVATAGLGVAFAAVTLATGSLWPVIVVHLLLDLANAVQAAAPRVPTPVVDQVARAAASGSSSDLWVSALVNVALGALAAAYGLVLVRRGAGRIAAERAEHGR